MQEEIRDEWHRAKGPGCTQNQWELLQMQTSQGVTVTVLAQPLAVLGTSAGRDSSVSIVQSVG